MFITEYNQERHDADLKAEGIEEGMAKGRAEGRAEGGLFMLFGLVKDGLLTLSQAAERANMPVAEFKLQMEQM